MATTCCRETCHNPVKPDDGWWTDEGEALCPDCADKVMSWGYTLNNEGEQQQ